MKLKRHIIVFGLTLGLVTGEARAQAPHFLSPFKRAVDTPVVLEWESHPAGIYTVEYSVALTADWKPVEQGFPSQGTTTRWTDSGKPTPDAFRFTSADNLAPHRFYRLKLERLM